jgi:hypothetical protein
MGGIKMRDTISKLSSTTLPFCGAFMLLLGALGAEGAYQLLGKESAIKQNQHQTVLTDSAIGRDQVSGMKRVRGEVLKMENNSYLVRDESGKEVRLIVNKDSKVEKAFEVGDWIDAQVSEEGTVRVITKSADAQAPATRP